MITPDDKDWTWVLRRPCGECGFDASGCPSTSVPDLVRANAQRWQELLTRGVIRAGRNDPDRLSSLEYACHVRDVFRRYDERIVLMMTTDDPLYPNWDQDHSAVAEGYDSQDPVGVVTDLGTYASVLAQRLDGLSRMDWERKGRRSDGASFTIDTLSRYMVHDPIHHLWDVTGQGSPDRPHQTGPSGHGPRDSAPDEGYER
jgi:hypothetical protein